MLDQVKIYVNDLLIDGVLDLGLGLSYKFQDIADPTVSDTSGSVYDFRVKATPNNKRIFGHLNLVNSVRTFDVEQKNKCVVKGNTLDLINGYCTVKAVLKQNDTETDYYEMTVFDVVNNFYTALGKKLSELNLQEFDHTLTYENVKNSWATSIKSFGNDVGFSIGNGYVYGMVNYGGNNKQRSFIWNVEGFRPHLYNYTLFDKIISEAGFTWETTPRFEYYLKNTILTPPAAAGSLTPEEEEELLFKAGLTADSILNTPFQFVPQLAGTAQHPPLKVRLNNDNTFQFGENYFDNGSDYNTTTFEYTAPIRSIQNLKVNLYVNMQFERDTNFTLFWKFFEAKTQITLYRNRAGVETALDSLEGALWYVPQGNAINVLNYTFATQSIAIEVSNVDCYPGDRFYVRLSTKITGLDQSGFNNNIKWKFVVEQAGSMFYNEIVNDRILEGNTVHMKRYVPDWTQLDYFNSFRKAFNLLIDYDENDDKHLIIKPRSEFFDFTNPVTDWVFDERSDEIIEPIPYKQPKEFHLGYELNEKININKWNNDVTGETYGEKIINSTKDLASEVKELGLLFGDSIMQYDDTTQTRIVTSMFNWEPNVGGTQMVDYVPTILFYRLLNSPTNYYIHHLNGAESYTDLAGTYDGLTTQTQYPYCGTLDDPYSPSLSLLFDTDVVWSVNMPTITTATLYNEFWKDVIDELYHPEASAVTAFAYLTYKQIYDLDFSRPIFKDNLYYYIDEIFQYNPLDSELTQVKLILFNNIGKNRNYKRDIIIRPTPGTGIPQRKPLTGVVQMSPYTGNQVRSTSVLDNLVRGLENIINGSYNMVVGLRNSVTSSALFNGIFGAKNTITGSNTLISGNNNINSGNNSLIVGNNNTNTANNAILLGDGINNSNSGIITVLPIIQYVNYIDAGTNIIVGEFPESTTINYISAGRDNILGSGSTTVINYISAGRNSIL